LAATGHRGNISCTRSKGEQHQKLAILVHCEQEIKSN
jgi:hypothetical protein